MFLCQSIRITTPALNYIGDMCLEFAYHMYGLTQGILHAYIQTGFQYSSAVRTAFIISSQDINEWIPVRVTIQTVNYTDRVRTCVADITRFWGSKSGNEICSSYLVTQLKL